MHEETRRSYDGTPAALEPQGSVVPATTTEGGTKEVIAVEFLCRREKEM